ncbi:restriction endonuclease subunit S [Chromobacterium haemolyticum]|nr:restriction endonuclease subunit S [Chromobacterium haemolyticum]
MSSEWKESTIGAVCSRVFSGGTPTSTKSEYYGSDIPWLRTKEVNYTKIYSTEETISEAGLAASSAKIVPVNSVVVAMYGNGDTAGRVAITKVPLTTNQACCNLVIDPSEADYRFIYYYLKASYKALVDLKNGGAQQNLNGKLIKSFPIQVPEVEVQREIGSFLESLDDRITLLRETNATLEAIAQALFKSWFVDFDPVRAKMEGRAPEGMVDATAALFPDGVEESELGLVPRGWRVCPIGDVVESVGGGTPNTKESSFWEPGEYCWTTPKDLSGVQAPVLLTTERKLSAKGLSKVSSGLLPAGTLLMSSRAPIGYLAIAQTPLAINQGYIAMLPSSRLPPLYMLFWCRHNMENIKGRANGSTFMEISKKAFRPIPALVPSEPILAAFVDVAEPLFTRLVENEKQAETLAALSTLLPRLISGQLRLPEAEALIA